MITIDTLTSVVTIIAVHSCLPENQDALEKMLRHAARDFYARQKGFVSSSIHKSVDGGTITNYAQWQSAEDLARAGRNAANEKFIGQVNSILINFEAHIYTVSSIIEA